MRASNRRGFTLTELLVGLVVTSIVMVAVTSVVIGIQQGYQADTEMKVVTESGRTAIDYLERTVALAGYGIDPRIAFDTSGDGGAVAGFNGEVLSDHLAFRYRDPSFGVMGSLAGTTLNFATGPGYEFPAGTMFMLMCSTPQADGTFPAAFVRLDADVAATATSTVVSAAGAPFNIINTTDPCISSNARVFLVRESRIRVVNIPEVVNGVTSNRPWLVRFRSVQGEGDPSDAGSYDPIAPDVENFQVAYAMQTNPDGGAPVDGAGNNSIVGDGVAGDAVVAVAQPTNPFIGQPVYTTPYSDSLRFINVPANIRAVHVALSVRSTRRDPTGRRAYTPERLFDGRPDAGADGFNRSTFHTVIPVINMMSRAGFLPALRSEGVAGDANFKGG